MIINDRWTPMRPVAAQTEYWNSKHRFNVVPAGRRSGKTELAKRKLVLRAIIGTAFKNANFFAAAPTRDQAKRIYWDDLKAMVPSYLIRGRPMETELCIHLKHGPSIWIVGMDKPERIEGQPWDGGVLDEYGNMKPNAWRQNIRPALADRNGWCDFIGVPEGRNHYYKIDKEARRRYMIDGDGSPWRGHHWTSAEVLPESEIEQMRIDLDPLTFDQECNARFVSFAGRIYYCFESDKNCARLEYHPNKPLLLMFDFNVEPGVCAVGQEMLLPNGLHGTGIIGEVWIPRNSNTPAVCRKIIADWGKHQSTVQCFGDATGGNRGSAKVAGSDWDLIKQELHPVFRHRLSFRVSNSNPKERSRVNAVNSRLMNTAGQRHLFVDPDKAPHVVDDFEGVRTLDGGSGEIDKKRDPELTHISDAIGYYIAERFPVESQSAQVVKILGV